MRLAESGRTDPEGTSLFHRRGREIPCAAALRARRDHGQKRQGRAERGNDL